VPEEKQMNEFNSQPEKPIAQPPFSHEQYDMLKRCSDSKNITEWNQWRLKNPREEIFLEGRNFSRYYLKGAYLCTDNDIYDFGTKTKLSGKVHLKGANFSLAHLENSFFHKALLQNATLKNAYLQNAVLWCADISGTSIENARVNGSTSFWKCKVNRYSPNVKFTDFSGVSLSSLIIEPSKKQRLEYNIRRKNWEEWYPKQNCLLRWIVRAFWWISDYGISTKRIIFTFFGLALFFAAVYSIFAYLSPPGIVSNLEVEPHSPLWHYFLLLLIRPVYLSIVTMTIGFGNMDANVHSLLGHILVGLQVILGYVLLGALVTRFAVLFTAGGPAGKFANEKKD
jgi:hypothetical protein